MGIFKKQGAFPAAGCLIHDFQGNEFQAGIGIRPQLFFESEAIGSQFKRSVENGVGCERSACEQQNGE